jgi:3-oxoadipate enol-lactonase
MTAGFPGSEQHIDTARGAMAWLEAGAGWPLILLHAFPLDANMWRPQLEAVPSGWRYIAPHFRGFGAGPPTTGPLSVDDYAADVFALLDALNIDAAAVGGLSMGGYVAFAMFRKAPERFTAMILADTRAQADTPEGRQGRVQMRAQLAAEGPGAIAAQMLPKLLSPGATPEVVEAVRRTIASGRPDAIDAAIAALMARPDSTPLLARINVPTLVVVGDADAITPIADAEAMQRAIGRSTLTAIPGAGHLANLEQPRAFSRALDDFLRSAL